MKETPNQLWTNIYDDTVNISKNVEIRENGLKFVYIDGIMYQTESLQWPKLILTYIGIQAKDTLFQIW